MPRQQRYKITDFRFDIHMKRVYCCAIKGRAALSSAKTKKGLLRCFEGLPSTIHFTTNEVSKVKAEGDLCHKTCLSKPSAVPYSQRGPPGGRFSGHFGHSCGHTQPYTRLRIGHSSSTAASMGTIDRQRGLWSSFNPLSFPSPRPRQLLTRLEGKFLLHKEADVHL